MPSNYTENYQLSQWEATDQVKREDFNADNAKIDAALAAAGNCQIITGSYVGNGKYGQDDPNFLTFPKQPILVIIDGTLIAVYGADEVGFAIPGNIYADTVKITWTDLVMQWYARENAIRQLNTAGKTYRYIAFVLP